MIGKKSFATDDANSPLKLMKNSQKTLKSKKKTPEQIKRANALAIKLEKEIDVMQSVTSNLIPKGSFTYMVRDIATRFNPGIRFQSMAVTAIQESAEAHLVNIFEDANQCARHS